MKLYTKAQLQQLLKNHAVEDPKPVVKWFTPDANATWLICSINPGEQNLAFGLCDLGLGFPELGDIWIPEILKLRGPYRLPVERDRHFTPQGPISVYADFARSEGRIAV